MKVVVIGAAGGTGQALSLLLKTQLPPGSDLSLYDIMPVTKGIAVDLSHIPSAVTVKGYFGDSLPTALEGADIVLITAGVARKPGMDRSDLFNINAGIIYDLVKQVGRNCPKACLGIITNPVNTLVPIAANVLKKLGVYDPRKLFGITTLDVIRASFFVGSLKNEDSSKITVPVIGGHSGITILPLLSQVNGISFSDQEVEQLTSRIQNAGNDVVEAKAGDGAATLSMGYAALKFTMSLVDGLQGKPNKVEYAFVAGNTAYAPYFSQPVLLGREGVKEYLDVGPLSTFEQQAVEKLSGVLKLEIELGEQFFKERTSTS